MNKALQRVVARLPQYWRQMLKQWSSRRQIKAGRFRIPEKEYDILPKYLKQGDWVLDVGANIRHYTVRFAELVGPTGRVIAFEPMSATFSLFGG